MPFKKGISGNPSGRPKTSVKDLVRLHPQRNELVQKLFDVAMDDQDKRQVSAWRILLPKMVPDLKAMQMEVEQKKLEGVIVLPEKVALDPQNVYTIGSSGSEKILEAMPGTAEYAQMTVPGSGAEDTNGDKVVTDSDSPRESTRFDGESEEE